MENYSSLTIIVLIIIENCSAVKLDYLATEHPKINYLNHEYVPFANFSARRFGRHDPNYYIDINYDCKFIQNSSLKVDVYVYEFLTSTYKPSFFEIHSNYCEFVEKDKMFLGPSLRKQPSFNRPCPHPPGVFRVTNATMCAVIPKGAPFTKGRIYINFTIIHRNINIYISEVQLDFELRTLIIPKKLRSP